ncbi:unnamed protein product [Parnassius mnemosyne]|uniref:Uncharacterized protein n=1 Tax=Parnassius mnemosyne TaxID=213953 RepID=A0AAV1LIR3_9NEOP
MSVGKIGEFDLRNGAWSSYVERLEMYFLVNQIKAELKLPTLIAVIGDEAYELLANLASPKKPSELSYGDVVELLRQHLQPTPSVHAERYRFRQRRQASNENIASYVADLKKLARHCKFKEALNENLRDQFVCGLRSDVIRQRLFAEDELLPYTSVVKIATSLVAAERDAAAVEGATTTGKDTRIQELTTVHALTRGGAWQRGERMRRGGGAGERIVGAAARSGAGVARGTVRTRSNARTNFAGDPGAGGHQFNCGGCGATDHEYSNCRFRVYICSMCRRPGHLRRVYPDAAGKTRIKQTAAPLHYGGADGAVENEEVPEADFHHLCLNDYQPVSLPVIINNKTIKMEVDTGAAVSCINRQTYEKYFNHHPIKNSKIVLNCYDGSRINPLGIIKPVVRLAGRTKRLELFVIEGGTTSLLGRQ